MAKFFGKVGFAGSSVETAPGVWEEQIVERNYYGDVIRSARKLDEGEKVNNDISVGNSISIVADEHALNHFFAIRYVEWAGARWTVTDVEVQRPRLILRLKGVYRGQPPTTP
jgi:hypothetical protein